MPQGSSAVRPTDCLYLYLCIKFIIVRRGTFIVEGWIYFRSLGLHSRCCHSIFQWHVPSDRTLDLGRLSP